MPLKQTVSVWNQLVETIVWQKSKTVWEAIGDYVGETIRTKGASTSAAVKHWLEAARYRGNGGPPHPVSRYPTPETFPACTEVILRGGLKAPKSNE